MTAASKAPAPLTRPGAWPKEEPLERSEAYAVKTYYAAVTGKNAAEIAESLEKWEASKTTGTCEVEVKQVIPMAQQALVIYVLYERGTLR